MLLHNDKNGLGRSSQQNTSEEGSETLSHIDTTLREEVSPSSCVDSQGFIMGLHF